MNEAGLKGLLHIFSSILGSHGRSVINGVTGTTVESVGSQSPSTWFQFRMQGPETVGPGKRQAVGWMGKDEPWFRRLGPRCRMAWQEGNEKRDGARGVRHCEGMRRPNMYSRNCYNAYGDNAYFWKCIELGQERSSSSAFFKLNCIMHNALDIW